MVPACFWCSGCGHSDGAGGMCGSVCGDSVCACEEEEDAVCEHRYEWAL